MATAFEVLMDVDKIDTAVNASHTSGERLVAIRKGGKVIFVTYNGP